MTPDHPDTPAAYHALKQIQRGGRQAIEDKAIDAYHRALDDGKGREESEEEYFKHFNSKTYNNVKSIKSQKNN